MNRPTPINPYQLCLFTAAVVILTLSYRRFFTSNIDMLALSVHDDSFYYLLPAFNFSRYGFFTFDGIHPTYGFQPLYAIALAAINCCVGSLHNLLRCALFFNAVIFVSTSFLLYSSLKKALHDKPEWIQNIAGIFGALCFLMNVPVFLSFITVKENALACFLLAIIVDIFFQIKENTSKRLIALPLLFGTFSGLLLLTRLLPSTVFILFVLFFSLRRWSQLNIYAIAGLLTPVFAWGAYAYYSFGRLIPTSSSIKAGFLTVFAQTPEAGWATSPLLVPFEYLYQAARFSVGIPSKFHYILQPNGWILDGAPTTLGFHTIFMCVGLFSVLIAAGSWKKLHTGDLLIPLLLFPSALGLFITPFLIKAKDLYYFTWYIYDQPYLLPFTFALAFALLLQNITPHYPRITQNIIAYYKNFSLYFSVLFVLL
ncbi:MAG: hypothetical protein P9L94_18445 [Candidatus Hinthialibacter antarcticus]|nr:hypothetical protein [Candidatus Hinthialibacter antarcticus]